MGDLQKELKIRRRIESIFNRSLDDFETLQDFGDYEEQKEDIIFNLSQAIDVEAMEEKIAMYQRQNYAEILRNEAKKAESKRMRIEEQAPKMEQPTREKEDEKPAADQPNASAARPGYEQPSFLPPAPAMLEAEMSHLQPGEAWLGREAMGLVSGWNPEMPRRRALEEAYSTLC